MIGMKNSKSGKTTGDNLVFSSAPPYFWERFVNEYRHVLHLQYQNATEKLLKTKKTLQNPPLK